MNCPRCNFPINEDNVWSNCPKCNCKLDRNNNPSQNVRVAQPKRPETYVTRNTSPSTNYTETSYRPRHTAAAPKPTASFCPNCGCPTKKEYIFCPNCGSSTGPKPQNNNYVHSIDNNPSSFGNYGLFFAKKGINKLFISEIFYLIYTSLSAILIIYLIAMLNKATTTYNDESLLSALVIISVFGLIVVILSYVFRFIGAFQLSKNIKTTKVVFVLLIIEPLLAILSAILSANSSLLISFLPRLLEILSFSANLGFSLIIILEIRSTQDYNHEQTFFSKKVAIILFISICLGFIIFRTIMYSSLNNMLTSEYGFLEDSLLLSIRRIAVFSLLSNLLVIIKNIYFAMYLNKTKRMF